MAAIPRFFLSAAQQTRRQLLLFTHIRLFHFLPATSPRSPADRPALASAFGLRTTLVVPEPQSPHFLLFGRTRGFASASKNTNSNASFEWSDDEDDDGQEGSKNKAAAATKEIDKSKLPPPYDPFSKKPVIEEPDDPKDLQEIFHRMRTEGLTNHAIKMFDALSKDGLTHEALALFAQIKDKGNMPDVVAHTAVIEAYANAGGHSKEAIRNFDRMLASGVAPNAYTYAVLVKGMSRDGKLKEASKYVMEMMGKGMKPNVGTYVAVFEAYVKEQRAEDAARLLEEMKGKGFVPEEKAVREHLSKRGTLFRNMMNLLFGK